MTSDSGQLSHQDVALAHSVDSWHCARRLVFMFVFVFVVLTALPFPFGDLGIPGPVGACGRRFGRRSCPGPPYGLYDVDSMARNGVARSLIPEDSTLWARLAIGQSRSTIRLTSGTLGHYSAAVDTAHRIIRFTSRDDAGTSLVLAYERPDTGRLVLRGRFGADSVTLSLRRRDETRYRLVSHGFHWAQNGTENR